MATRDQMIADALKEVKEALSKLAEKFDTKMEERGKELSAFKEKYADEMATLRTQVKIYAGMAAAIGTAAGAIISKILFK